MKILKELIEQEVEDYNNSSGITNIDYIRQAMMRTAMVMAKEIMPKNPENLRRCIKIQQNIKQFLNE